VVFHLTKIKPWT